MQFHQDTVERIRDNIFKIMIDKNMVREGLTFNDLIKDFPPFNDNCNDDTSDDEYSDVPQVKEEVFNDNIQDDNTTKDNIKKVKKEKKKKEVDPNKPKKKPNGYIVFKTHPDNQELISQKAEEINEDTGKPHGKVKAAGFLWKELSEEQQEEWKNKSIE